jgi:hypothetical protein
MAKWQEPQSDIIRRAKEILRDPTRATQLDAERMAAYILDDEENASLPTQKAAPVNVKQVRLSAWTRLFGVRAPAT